MPLSYRICCLFPAFILLISFAAGAREFYVFLGSFNRDTTTAGIAVYHLDTSSGQLAFVTAFKGIPNPSYLTLSPDGRYMYACTESKTPGAGSVSSFAFDPQAKTLRLINSRSSVGENPVYLSVHPGGRWLVNANYTQASLSVYPLAPDGSIGEVNQLLRFSEGSINPERQMQAHLHASVFNEDGQYLFAPDLGADKIRCFRFDSSSGQLSVAKPPFVSTTPGSGPRHFCIHPSGRFAYCIEELSGTVSVYRCGEGQLDLQQRIPAHPRRLKAGFESADIHISPDGGHLYVSNRGRENNLAVFSIQRSGNLDLLGFQPGHGLHPRIFALDPLGNFLLVAHVESGKVVVFRRDKVSGQLRYTGQEMHMPFVSCVQIRSY